MWTAIKGKQMNKPDEVINTIEVKNLDTGVINVFYDADGLVSAVTKPDDILVKRFKDYFKYNAELPRSEVTKRTDGEITEIRYTRYGSLHREDNTALIRYDGDDIVYKGWFLYGIPITSWVEFLCYTSLPDDKLMLIKLKYFDEINSDDW